MPELNDHIAKPYGWFETMNVGKAHTIAVRLKEQADELIYKRGLDSILKRYGSPNYTGSYALNLMAWPDLDVNMALHSKEPELKQAASLLRELALFDDTSSIKLNRDLHLRNPQLPRGIYIGVRLNFGGWKLPWKVDLWLIDAEQIERNRELMSRLLCALTPELSALILQMKHDLMMPNGRTPSFSGLYLYEAILFEKLFDGDSIRSYLRTRGVVLSE